MKQIEKFVLLLLPKLSPANILTPIQLHLQRFVAGWVEWFLVSMGVLVN